MSGKPYYNLPLFWEMTENGKLGYKGIIPGLKEEGPDKMRRCKNPNYRDKNGDFCVYLGDDGQWRHHDHGDETFSGNVIDFAMQCMGITPEDDEDAFIQAIEYVLDQCGFDKDEFLIKKHAPTKRELKKATLSLDEANSKFWLQYGVTKETLQEYHVSYVRYYPTKGQQEEAIECSPFVVIYDLGLFQKYYVPNPKSFWYKGKKTKGFVFGMREIVRRNTKAFKAGIPTSPILIITGGEKDVLALSALGYDAVSLNSETISRLPQELMEMFEAYEKVLVLYDRDETGERQTGKLCEKYDQLTPVYLPDQLKELGGKDIADYIKLGLDIGELRMVIENAGEDNLSITSGDESTISTNHPSLPETETDGLLLDNTIYEQLPEFLKSITSHHESGVSADLILLSTIHALSSAFPKFYSIYDQMKLNCNSFFVVCAPPASGKGKVGLCKALLAPIDDLLQEEYDVQKRIYERDTKDNPSLVEPQRKLLIIPANSSEAAMTKIMNANVGFGLVIDTEADTFTQTKGQKWGVRDDFYRKAYHHEEISTLRASEVIKVKRPCLSLILTGTPNQLAGVVESVENGFFSRNLFYRYDPPIEWRDAFRNDDVDLGGLYDEWGQEVKKWWRYQESMEEVRISYSQEQKTALLDFFDKRLRTETKTHGRDIAGSMYRLGPAHQRICMALTAIRYFENGEAVEGPIIICDDDFDSACKMIDCHIAHLKRIVRDIKDAKPTVKLTPDQHKFLKLLPNEFSKQQAIKVVTEMKKSKGACDRWLSILETKGLLIKTSHGHYAKVQDEQE